MGPPIGIKIISLAGSLIILMVFAIYFVMPIYYMLSDEGDQIAADFDINTTTAFNNTKELYTQETLNEHFYVIGLSFGFLALLIVYFHYHNKRRPRGAIRYAQK